MISMVNKGNTSVLRYQENVVDTLFCQSHAIIRTMNVIRRLSGLGKLNGHLTNILQSLSILLNCNK